MNNAAINICAKFMWTHVFISLESIPSSGIAGSYGKSRFNILRNYQTIIQSGHTILHSHQQCLRVPISILPHQHLFFSVFLIVAILVGVKWYLIAVLICISLIANDVDHLFMWATFWIWRNERTWFIFSVLLFFEGFYPFMV